jgi:hypothetical protein
MVSRAALVPGIDSPMLRRHGPAATLVSVTPAPRRNSLRFLFFIPRSLRCGLLLLRSSRYGELFHILGHSPGARLKDAGAQNIAPRSISWIGNA